MTPQFPPAQPPGPGQPWQSGAARQPPPQQPWQQSQQWQPQQQQPWQQQPQQQQQQPEAGQPKRRKALLLGAAATTVALGVALTLILSLTGGPDLSSPQAAAQSWANAVNDKDAGAVIDTVCPEQVLTTSSAAVDALQESIDAAPGGATVQKVDIIDATNAVATLNVPSGTTDTNLTSTTVLDLKRIDGNWYVCGGGPTPMGG